MKTFQKPLTPEEERCYLRILREADEIQAGKAKEVLIERNLRLVAHIAKKYQNSGEDMDDLISIGCIGLIKAVDTFDIKRGKLVTYASRCIENELLMYMRSRKKTSKEVSLYESIGHDKEGNEIKLMDVIEQKNIDIIEKLELDQNKKQALHLLKERLNARERQIIIMRYGLMGVKEYTQNEIAERLGISRSYVSRIEKKALGKLKEGFAEKEQRF